MDYQLFTALYIIGLLFFIIFTLGREKLIFDFLILILLLVLYFYLAVDLFNQEPLFVVSKYGVAGILYISLFCNMKVLVMFHSDFRGHWGMKLKDLLLKRAFKKEMPKYKLSILKSIKDNEKEIIIKKYNFQCYRDYLDKTQVNHEYKEIFKALEDNGYHISQYNKDIIVFSKEIHQEK